MTKEEATKILARMLEKDANGANPNDTSITFFGAYFAPDERSAIIYALQEMNGAEKKAPTLPKADPPKTWIRASEINDVVNKAVKEAMKREHDKTLLEAIREIVEAEYFRVLVDCLVIAAEKRREGVKDDI